MLSFWGRSRTRSPPQFSTSKQPSCRFPFFSSERTPSPMRSGVAVSRPHRCMYGAACDHELGSASRMPQPIPIPHLLPTLYFAVDPARHLINADNEWPPFMPTALLFKHDPLPDPASHLRLLEILQTSSIKCKLTTRPADPDNLPSYHAISYTWAEHDSNTIIWFNGKPFPVRTNCEFVLRHLSRPAGTARALEPALLGRCHLHRPEQARRKEQAGRHDGEHLSELPTSWPVWVIMPKIACSFARHCGSPSPQDNGRGGFSTAVGSSRGGPTWATGLKQLAVVFFLPRPALP